MDMMSYLMGKKSGGAKGLQVEVVTELPEIGEADILYLVPKEDTGDNDIFDEYLWVDNDWEHIGSTDIDLSNYYTKSEVDALLPSSPIYYLDIGVNASYYSGNVYISDNARTTLGSIITDAYANGYKFIALMITDSSGNVPFLFYHGSFSGSSNILSKPTSLRMVSSIAALDGRGETLIEREMLVSMTWSDNIATVSSARISSQGHILVETSGDQNVGGVKTFTSGPRWGGTPSRNDELANKKYVDDNIPDVSNYYTKSEVDDMFYNDGKFYHITAENRIFTGQEYDIGQYGYECYLTQDIANKICAAVNDSRDKGLKHIIIIIHNNHVYGDTEPSVVTMSGYNYCHNNTLTLYAFYPTYFQGHSYSYSTRTFFVTSPDENNHVQPNGNTSLARVEYGFSDYCYLSKTNTTSYTPSGDYNPATKKYVDDAISSAITDALGGSY